MTVQMKIKFYPDVINYFKELLFYNRYIGKPKIKLTVCSYHVTYGQFG